MENSIIHISRPLALLTRGHAKKIDLTPNSAPISRNLRKDHLVCFKKFQ